MDVTTIARLVLAALILIFGANGIFKFLPVPLLPERANIFRNALLETGYMLPLWKGTEFIGAALLITGFWVPFALVLLAPILVNILFFHLFLAPKGTSLAVILILLESTVAYGYREAFISLFK